MPALTDPTVQAERRAKAPAAGFEVRLVVGEPPEIVVERTVLHHHDHDGVDRAVGGRLIQNARRQDARRRDGRLAGPRPAHRQVGGTRAP
jgi:hypothetical protein